MSVDTIDVHQKFTDFDNIAFLWGFFCDAISDSGLSRYESRWKCWLKRRVIFAILSGLNRTVQAQLWKEMNIQKSKYDWAWEIPVKEFLTWLIARDQYEFRQNLGDISA